jgi:plastocyanin domain-containing protein
MSTIMINLAGLLLMAAVIWWFWLSGKRQAVQASDGVVEILVANGVYLPDRVAIGAGKPVTMRFTREDPTPCAEVVKFDGLAISRELPLHKTTEVSIRYDQPGEYLFTCQMGMYKGYIVVS